MQKKRWHIFCKVIDNFGDIGVCWRLAKQLSNEYGIAVQLYVDDLITAQKIIPKVDYSKATQNIELIELNNIKISNKVKHSADVVIEAFTCGLPKQYQENMHEKCVWINLEHLCAEKWVVDCHAKYSQFNHTPLLRHFYFSGFQPEAGGLLREQGLIKTRNRFAGSAEQSAFIAKYGLMSEQGLLISLFAYENAPLTALFEMIVAGDRQVTVLAPLNAHLQAGASFFGQSAFEVNQCLTKGQLTLKILPFLSQASYDYLLWYCDINFVRGEDSWVRAIWAGKPFIWQPYVQSEDVHLKKLDAFLALYYQNTHALSAISTLHYAWSNGHLNAEIWKTYIKQLPEIKRLSLHKSNQLSNEPSLAEKLVAFCANMIG